MQDIKVKTVISQEESINNGGWLNKSIWMLDILLVSGGIRPIRTPDQAYKKILIYTCCVISFCLHVINIVRLFMVLWMEDEFGMSILVKLVFLMANTSAVIFTIILNYHQNTTRYYFTHFQKLEDKFETVNGKLDRYIKLASISVLTISFVTSLMFFALSVYISIYLTGPHPLKIFWTAPLHPTDKNARAISLTYTLYSISFYSGWFSPVLLFIIFTMTLIFGLNENIKKFKSTQKKDIINEELENIRNQHQKLCHLLDVADDVISGYLGVAVGDFVIKICIILFVVARDSQSNLVINSAMIFTMVYILCVNIVIMFGGIQLNEKVRIQL